MTDQANILIVDDEEVVRLSYLRSLAGTPCNTEVAGDGTEALRVLEEQPIDVILLDLRMPDLNGMDVLKIVKDKWPDCEVVIITGYPSIESAKEAVRLGAYNYLAKPVAADEVVKAASGAINHKRWALRSDGNEQTTVQKTGDRETRRSSTNH